MSQLSQLSRCFSESGQLTASLASRGFSVVARDGKLLVSPASRLTPDDAATIAANREALLAELSPFAGPVTEPSIVAALAAVAALPASTWTAAAERVLRDAQATLDGSADPAAFRAWFETWCPAVVDMAKRGGAASDWRFNRNETASNGAGVTPDVPAG